jgi:hypothetical protein
MVPLYPAMAALPARIVAGVSAASIAGTSHHFRNSIWRLPKFLASLLAVDSNAIVAATRQEHEVSIITNTCDEFGLRFDDSPTFEICVHTLRQMDPSMLKSWHPRTGPTQPSCIELSFSSLCVSIGRVAHVMSQIINYCTFLCADGHYLHRHAATLHSIEEVKLETLVLG